MEIRICACGSNPQAERKAWFINMKNNRLIGAISIFVMLAGCMTASVLYGNAHKTEVRNSYAEELPVAPIEENPLEHIGEDFIVDENFTSHLPIVVLDTNGVEPPINTYEDYEQARFVAIKGVEPYVDGRISVIAGKNKMNCLTDTPQLSSAMRIKRRGNSSMLYEKAQWMVKLVTESGQDNDVDVLGMGMEHEWILNGSMFDKSLLRNYLAYSIASEFMPYTPDNQYCEVILKDGDQYTYQGVYLLGESIKQGPDRVNIAEYKKGEVINSYLVRRDRFEEDVNILDTYGLQNGCYKEYLELRYPSTLKADETIIQYAQMDISAMEKVLYSEEPEVFSTYPEVLDVDSFVDYFLFNEFFGSYDSGNFSTYFYKDVGGKITMGPVWDYDGTMDNYKKAEMDMPDLAFQTKPWFDRLCKDEHFIKQLEKRYVELRRTSLSENHVIEKIDEIVAYLGGAQERDWYRWGHWYTTTNKYSLLPEKRVKEPDKVRNAVTYQDEIYRIKTMIREHGDYIPEALRKLEKLTDTTTGMDSKMGWLLLLAACVFMIPAGYVSMRK